MSDERSPHLSPDAPDFEVIREVLRHCHPKFPEARYQLEQAEAALVRIEEALVDGFNHEQDLVERFEALREFFEAHWAHEQGIVDFDLHASQVERLRAAQGAAYRMLHPPVVGSAVAPAGGRDQASAPQTPPSNPASRPDSESDENFDRALLRADVRAGNSAAAELQLEKLRKAVLEDEAEGTFPHRTSQALDPASEPQP